MQVLFGINSGVLPVLYTTTLVQWLVAEGYSESTLLESTGLTAAMMNPSQEYMGSQQHRQLILNALRLTGNRHLGLYLGKRLNLTVMSMIGYAAMKRGSVGEAIETIVLYFKTRAPFVNMTFCHTNKQACILIEEAPHCGEMDDGEIREFIMESCLAALGTVFTFVLGDYQPIVRAQGCLPLAEDWCEHKQTLLFPVDFEQKRHALELDIECLNQPLPIFNPTAARVTQTLCEELLTGVSAQSGIVSRVRQLLLDNIGQFPGLDQTAAQLCVSSRTLRRKLQQVDTTFQTVLDETREGLAMLYLTQTKMSVQAIAMVLGYTDSSNFGRAFRKWTQKSPSQLRY